LNYEWNAMGNIWNSIEGYSMYIKENPSASDILYKRVLKCCIK